jgi:2-methylcitrate dehydratase PrpD
MEPKHAALISGQFAQYAANLRYNDLPQDVRKLAHLVLLDTLGCAMAGAGTEEVAQIRRAMTQANGGGNGGDSIFWGTTEKAPLPMAALANGAAVHAREIDDFGGCAHSGSVVIPSALGVAARTGASGRELLTAIVIGYDIARRVMDGGGGYQAMKDRGWHSTSTCGGFGAAAAAGRLLGLNTQRLQWALGYAGSNAGGTWAYIPEGAMSKRVHPGFAAHTGIVAAYLAANDVTGPASIFEAPWGGYYPTYVPGIATPEAAVKDLGRDFRIRLVGFKPYAACRGIHSSIDIMLDLRRKHLVHAADVKQVTVRGSPTHLKQLAKQDVQTLLDAQMSLPYSIAVSLVSGGAMLDQYTPEALKRPDVRDLARRVHLKLEPSVTDGAEPYVDVELNDGRVLTDRVLIARGDSENPLSENEVRAKFRTAASAILNAAHIARLEDTVMHAAELPDCRELASLLVPSSTHSEKLLQKAAV